MNPSDLEKKINDVRSFSDDPEAQHCAEDNLLREVIKTFCPAWVHEAIVTLEESIEERWYS